MNDRELELSQSNNSGILGEIHPSLHVPIQLPSLNIDVVASQVHNKHELPRLEKSNKRLFLFGLIVFIIVSLLTVFFGIALLSRY